MPFLTGSWVSVGKTTSPKRARSDSGLGFSFPTSKRTKRSLSDGDGHEDALAQGFTTQQRLPEKLVLARATSVHRLPSLSPAPAQDTPMIDSLADTASTILEDSRQASEALSSSSGATAVNLDSAIDAKADDFEDLFKLDLIMTSLEANHKNDPSHAITSFEKFSKLPTKLQVQVFKRAETPCPVGKCFNPYYKQGMLKGYIINKCLTSTEADSERKTTNTYIMNDNVDFLAPALFNKAYMEAYIEEFYSCNEFSFADPRAAMWFFKKIGGKFKYLRQLKLIINGGFQEDYQVHNFPVDAFTEITEELWWSVICWLEHRHKLQRLSLIFKKSPSKDELWRKHVEDDKIVEMMLLRQKIVCRLCRRWGIKSVKIEDATNSFFNTENDVFETQLAMQQTEIENGHQDKRKESLKDALDMAHSRLGATSDDRIEYISEYDEDKLANEEEQGDIYEASRIHQNTNGRSSNSVSESVSGYWTSQVQQEDQHQKSKGKGSSNAKAAPKSKTKQLIDQSKTQQNQSQTSFLRSTVNSIGNNAKSYSTSHQPAMSSTIPASQFYGGSSQQRNYGGSVNDVRNEYDRPSNARPGPRRNGRHGNGRRSQNFYGNRRHTFGGQNM